MRALRCAYTWFADVIESMIKKVLTIAGSDSGGGAGIQADLKTFCAFKVYGTSVITALTAQNTVGVNGVFNASADFVGKQLDAVLTDITIDAVKTGMLAIPEIVEIVAQKCTEYAVPNLVVDPVMVAKGGDVLLQQNAITALIDNLLPLAMIVTPNIPEAEILSGKDIKNDNDMEEAAKIIYNMGCANVLIKGGHRTGEAVDLLFDGTHYSEFRAPRLSNHHTHGTGCTLSAAITSALALGLDVGDAVARAKRFVTRGIEAAEPIGKGISGLNHFVDTE